MVASEPDLPERAGRRSIWTGKIGDKGTGKNTGKDKPPSPSPAAAVLEADWSPEEEAQPASSRGQDVSPEREIYC